MPGDEHEREADRIADHVVRKGLRENPCACGGGCRKCQAQHSRESIAHLQLKSPGAGALGQTAAPPTVRKVLGAVGRHLDSTTRGFMEPRFGLDFSVVRIHTDATAADSARAMNARAYTAGNNIVFGANQFQPGTASGRRLLAHELAHVVQQSASPAKTGGTGQSWTMPKPAGTLIQRSANFVHGKEPEDRNLAQSVIAQDEIAADAVPILNGTALTLTNERTPKQKIEQINSLIVPPVPKFNPLPGKGGVECWLESVGSNEGSYAKHLPSKPPWSEDTSVEKLRAAFTHYNISVPSDCKTQDGNTNLTVEGDPDSATLMAGVKAHEGHHAKDYEAAFNHTIVPWDKKLTDILAGKKKSADKFQGKDNQGCVNKILQRVGASLDVAGSFYKEITDAANVLHGSNPQITFHSPRALPSCSKAFVKAKL